ncbi:MAG: DUF1320 domain-containing protein [Pontibacter sp.]|nr:DUF1320 domain-containing protein [Pontibacter sp.]
MFLIPQDYESIIRNEIRDAIADDRLYNILASELAARAEMEGYLRKRFDVAKIFIDVLEWKETEQYTAGQSVYYTDPELGEQLVYKCLQDCKGVAPGAEAVEWELKDERHPSIKMYLLDITVYHLYTASPVIPQLRVNRYDAAIAWLKMVLKDEITPDLPLLAEPPQNTTILLGSRQKLRHIW